jgi:hypothetical protein
LSRFPFVFRNFSLSLKAAFPLSKAIHSMN